VETDNGTDLLENLSVPSFIPTSTKEVNETFYNLLLHDQYIGRGVRMRSKTTANLELGPFSVHIW